MNGERGVSLIDILETERKLRAEAEGKLRSLELASDAAAPHLERLHGLLVGRGHLGKHVLEAAAAEIERLRPCRNNTCPVWLGINGPDCQDRLNKEAAAPHTGCDAHAARLRTALDEARAEVASLKASLAKEPPGLDPAYAVAYGWDGLHIGAVVGSGGPGGPTANPISTAGLSPTWSLDGS